MNLQEKVGLQSLWVEIDMVQLANTDGLILVTNFPLMSSSILPLALSFV